MYSASDIVFVGGSLVKRGGQNLIEPASLGKPVIIGKYVFNFLDVVSLFLKDKACMKVNNKNELYNAIKSLIIDPRERRELGLRAKEVVLRNQGSSQRALGFILSLPI